MGEQNGKLYESIEGFLIDNAQEISELKIKLLKLHFNEIVKLAQNINTSKIDDKITEASRRLNKFREVFENFDKDDGGLYEYDADIFDDDDTETEEIRTKNLLFSIVRSLYLILCTSKIQGELTVLRDSLDKFKFNKDNWDIENYIKTYENYAKYIEYFKTLYPNNNLQPVLKYESKVVPPEQKRGILSRAYGLFGSKKKSGGGGKRIKYKSTGNEVVIFHKNRECRKTIYVKEKTTTKYCKINNKYILLSKLNVID
jgi:hypothetical protein